MKFTPSTVPRAVDKSQLFILDEDGQTFVILTGPKYELLKQTEGLVLVDTVSCGRITATT